MPGPESPVLKFGSATSPAHDGPGYEVISQFEIVFVLENRARWSRRCRFIDGLLCDALLQHRRELRIPIVRRWSERCVPVPRT